MRLGSGSSRRRILILARATAIRQPRKWLAKEIPRLSPTKPDMARAQPAGMRARMPDT